MEIKEENKSIIQNTELQKLVSLKLGKMPYEKIDKNEFKKIYEISLNSRLINGKTSGISLKAIQLFPNLRSLRISNYRITKEVLEMLASLEFLEFLDICNAEFDDDIDFKLIENKIRSLKFINCLDINFNYPKMSEIWLDRTNIDFSKIDLQTAKKITIINGTISNAFDLTDFQNIETVNLDGSTLLGKNNKKMSEIKVGSKTQYTHKDCIELFDK